MAVKIRLQRGGAAHAPHYRIVVAESRFRRDGRFIEVIGRYNPVAKRHSEKCTLEIDRADHWLSVGAQPTDTVRGLINRFRRGFYEPSEEELASKDQKAAPAPAPAPAPAKKEPVKVEEPAAEEAKAEPETPAEEEPTVAGEDSKEADS